MRALAMVLACIAASPVYAADVHKNPPKPMHMSDDLHRTPGACAANFTTETRDARDLGAPVFPIVGLDVATFLTIFNGVEPKTDYKADEILVTVAPQVAFVELFKGGCPFFLGKIPPSSFYAMMNAAFGGEPINAEWM